MRASVNGNLTTQVSVLDRGLQYGHSVFETIAVVKGKPRLFEQHCRRLNVGAKILGIPIDFNALKDEVNALIGLEINSMSLHAVLRITVTMGTGGRGYAAPEPEHINSLRILSLYDYPVHDENAAEQGILLGLSDVNLAHQPLLAGLKHGNRLEQILARSRWEKNWGEAVLSDHLGNVIEGTQSNLIVIDGNNASTPILDQCGVDGVMKNWALERLKESGFSCQAVRLSVNDIEQAEAVLMTNSIMGVLPVKQFKSTLYSDFNTANNLRTKLHNDDIIPYD